MLPTLTQPAAGPVTDSGPDVVDAYLGGLAAALDGLSRAAVWDAVDLLLATASAGRRIYLVGNGGSAATASHMANDLNKQASVPGAPLFRAIALTDNVPLITAWSNDEDYAAAFAMQLANHVETAREAGAAVIALTGDTGGALRGLVDVCLCVPSPLIGHQEDVHLVLNHVITTDIRSRLGAA